MTRQRQLARAIDAETSRQLIALRIASPKRADAGAIITRQHDASDCPLFVAAAEPTLF